MNEQHTTDNELDARYARSPITETWYRVTEWENLGDGTGQMVAIEKHEVDESDVPPVWKGALEWHLEDRNRS